MKVSMLQIEKKDGCLFSYEFVSSQLKVAAQKLSKEENIFSGLLSKELIYNKGDLHGGKTTMLYLNLSGH